MDYSEMVNDNRQEGGLFGVYPGVVADIEDSENMARVKVTFPWRDADDKSEWARLATPMAGKKMGTYFLPEKNDEVLVAFGKGDIHEPYIVGSLWNGQMKPPQENKKKNPIRQIKSRAGHTVTFDDTDDVGKIEIETKKGQKVVIDDKEEKITLKDKNKNEVKMDSNGIFIDSKGKIKLSGNDVKVNAKRGLSLSGQQLDATAKSKAKISSKGQLALSAKAKAMLQANGMLDVKSSGMLKMKGSMIMLN